MTGQVAGLVDLAPTLLSLCGVNIPPHFQGRDLAPVLCQQDAEIGSSTFVETEQGVAIRTTGHVYYLPFSGPDRALADEPEQFFDLTEDPYQLQDLSGSGRSTSIARDLDQRLRQWHASLPWMLT